VAGERLMAAREREEMLRVVQRDRGRIGPLLGPDGFDGNTHELLMAVYK
jgi:hypothetical protein